MVVTCQIIFDQNAHGTYFAGETVSGSIILTTDKTKYIKGLLLKINGFARTHWTEQTPKKNNNKNTQNQVETFTGREDYISTSTYLLGSEESDSIQLLPGMHNYTFSCTLPAHCPSSFEGKNGHIRYVAKIVLVRPWKFDQTYSRGFTVLKLLDLNYDSPVLRIPACQEIFKTFCCGPCSSRPLSLRAQIPQSGYVPGEDIVVTVTATNESTVPVVDLKISLVLFVTLFSHQPKMNTHLEQMVLAKLKSGAVNTKTTRTVTQFIRVPPTPPTCLNLCRIIKVSYELQVEAKLGKFHQNPVLTIPITIGNVPIVGVINQQPMPSSSQMQPTAPPRSELGNSFDGQGVTLSVLGQGQNSSNALPRNSLPPPSYEEAVYMNRADVNEEDKNPLGSSEFVPRYPVYCCTEATAPPENEAIPNHDPSKSTWL